MEKTSKNRLRWVRNTPEFFDMLIFICLLVVFMENNEKILEFLSLKLRKEIELEIHTFGSKKHKENLEKTLKIET